MEAILTFGILLILWLQALGGWLAGPMQFFTFLGNEEFYLLVAPAVFWCFNPAVGLRLGISLMLSGGVYSALKLALHGPRPYWIDPNVQPLSSEASFGIPSGHAQNAVIFWGQLARSLRRNWAWVLAILLMALIGLSRLYIGVHFPSDVAAGWLVGILLLWLIVRLEAPFLRWFRGFPTATQVTIALGASLVLILLSALARLALGAWQVPTGWIELAGRAPEAKPINPLALSGAVTAAAVLFGMACGAILLERAGWLDVRGSAWQRLARYLLGLAGVVILWTGLDLIFPSGETLIALVFRFIRYGSIGLWISYFAPLLFFRLKLAAPARSDA